MKTHWITEGVEPGIESREIVLDGSTTCPRPEWCDRKDGEEMEAYVRRHAREHEMDFPSQTAIEDLERNLTMYCGYYGHKYTIGNKTLTPYPFWEIHEFVFNWEFHPDDLEMQLWDEDDPAVASGYTFELKPADERLPGIYKRFKEVELPRGCQKTSIVSKAYVTMSQLRQRFIFDKIYHRIIITSATTTLTEGVTNALETLWAKNQRIKKLFGVNRYRTRYVAGREAFVQCDLHGECVSKMQQGTRKPAVCCSRATWTIPPVQDNLLLGRDSIYGGKTRNTISCRWVKDSEEASGMTAFSVLYAGIKTETQGQRADEYIFDDGNTKKNSKNDTLRAQVTECFEEQVNQLDPHGRFIVCNTRQHLHDFGGKIKTPEYRRLFHILHRRARFIDPVTGREKAYYAKDGLGRERYSLRVLDDMALLKPEAEMWSEYQNCPRDPKKKVFSRGDFQIVDLDDPRVPIEVRYGLGSALTQAQQAELAQQRVTIKAYNTSDLAGKEEQSVKGDSTWVGGHRFDRYGNWWIVYLAFGQWDSDETWRQQYLAWLYNRPIAHDYELPSSELHVRGSFEKWKADASRDMGIPITMMIDFAHMPKAGKPSRIEALTPWTKNKRIYVLSNVEARPRKVLLDQFHDYPQADHDDGPDMVSRCLRYVDAPSIAEVKAAMAAKEGPRIKDGKFQVSSQQFLDAFKEQRRGSGGAPNWGLRGRVRKA
jgi:hypothetical protein